MYFLAELAQNCTRVLITGKITTTKKSTEQSLIDNFKLRKRLLVYTTVFVMKIHFFFFFYEFIIFNLVGRVF